jgi:hypothetical protein
MHIPVSQAHNSIPVNAHPVPLQEFFFFEYLCMYLFKMERSYVG